MREDGGKQKKQDPFFSKISNSSLEGGAAGRGGGQCSRPNGDMCQKQWGWPVGLEEMATGVCVKGLIRGGGAGEGGTPSTPWVSTAAELLLYLVGRAEEKKSSRDQELPTGRQGAPFGESPQAGCPQIPPTNPPPRPTVHSLTHAPGDLSCTDSPLNLPPGQPDHAALNSTRVGKRTLHGLRSTLLRSLVPSPGPSPRFSPGPIFLHAPQLS